MPGASFAHPGQGGPQFFPQTPSGPVVIQASGGFGETLATLASTGTETIAATGAFTPATGVLAATGSERFQGTGAYSATRGVLAAVGSERLTGTAIYAANHGVAAGSGLVIVPVTATGAFDGNTGVLAAGTPVVTEPEFFESVVPGYHPGQAESEGDEALAGVTAAALWEMWMEP